MSALIQETVVDATEARIIRTYVEDLMTAGINPARIAVEANVSAQRLKTWLNGTGGENILPALATQDGGLRKLADAASAARVFAKASGKPIDGDLFKAAAVAAGSWGMPT